MKKIALLLYPVTGLFQSVFLRLHLLLLHALTRDFYDSYTVLVVLGKRLHGVALIFGSNGCRIQMKTGLLPCKYELE